MTTDVDADPCEWARVRWASGFLPVNFLWTTAAHFESVHMTAGLTP
jgi:hypothetical protein